MIDEIVLEMEKIDFLSHRRVLIMPHKLETDIVKASKSMNSLKWENLCIDQIGDFKTYLSKNYSKEYNENWNKFVSELKEKLYPSVLRELDMLVSENILLEDMKSQILFDIINIGMCKCYAKFETSQFYKALYDIYLAGYIPCGWFGKFPIGEILVY